MVTGQRIGAYVWFLTLTITVFAVAIIAFELNQSRMVNRFEDRLTNYHRLSILALSSIESDLFRFQGATLLPANRAGRSDDDFSATEFLALIESQMNTIVRLQTTYRSPRFAHAVSNLVDAHAGFEEHLIQDADGLERDLIIGSPEWIAFGIRVFQLQRLHSATSERVTAELTETRQQATQNTLVFSGIVVVIGLLIVSRIVTLIRRVVLENQRTSEALKESRHRAQAILDNAAEAIISIDERGRIEAFNQAAEDTFGYAASEVVGRNIAVLMPEPHRSGHDGYLRAYRETGVRRIIGMTRDIEGRKKDGTIFPMELSVSEVFVNGRRLFTGILLDISDRKQLEEQLRQSQKMDAIGRLAGGVAHDFNNILTVISGYTSLMRETNGLPQNFRNDLGQIEEAAGRAQELTRQLLAFSRKQMLQPKPMNLNDVVNGAAKMLERLIGEHIALELSLEPSLRMIEADASQIEQIILNLSLNARDAMAEGGTLRIETASVVLDEADAQQHAGIEPGRYCVLSVSDTGEGIDRAIRDRLFEPFFTTKEPGKGTGLGLSTVYGIVQQSDAHISFESALGEGTIFSVYFRSLDAETDTPAPAHAERPAWRDDASETVLIVEDEETLRKLVVRVLAANGNNVVEAGSANEALAVFRERATEIDLVVTDVIMPEMNGADLVRKLIAIRSDVPVLYMSGYTDNEIGRHGVLEADVNFIQKPFTPERLAEKVRSVLDAAQRQNGHTPETKAH